VRRLAVVAALLIAASPLPAIAAPRLPALKVLQVPDVTGDANAMNSQAGLVPASGGPMGVSVAGADIVSFTLARRDDGRHVLALVGTLTLAAAPAFSTDFRIRMSAPGCKVYFLEYERTVLGDVSYLRHTCTTVDAAGNGGATFLAVPAVVAGNTITWTVPVRDLPGKVKIGSVLSVTGAQTSGDAVAIGPTLDEVVMQATYRLGQ
jgi:hypothetical protein